MHAPWSVISLSHIGVRAFFARVSGQPFAQKFFQVAQIYTKQSKGNEGHTMHQQRPTYEVKIFLHMNLSYELKKHFKT